jgi:arabinofuranosyltransferase
MGRRNRDTERRKDCTDSEATGDAAPLLLAPVILACAGLFRVMHWFWGFVQDDAYISLRYAWFFAHGEGLVFNPGERVEGFTNLSWTVLAATFIRLGIDPLDGIRVVGGLSALALVALVWYEAGGEHWRTSRRAAWAAGAAAALISSFTTLAVWAVAGMEQSFFCLLLFAGYCFFVRGRYPQAAGVWVLAAFTRPEAPLAFALAAALRIVDIARTPRRPTRDELSALIIFVAGFAALMLYRLLYFGELAPNTFFVKGVANFASHSHGLTEMRKFLEFDAIGVSLGMAFIGILGTLWMPPRVADEGDPHARRPREEAAFGALYLVGMLYYLIRVGGDLLPMFRLYMPLLPFIALWSGRAVEWLASLVLVREDDLERKPGERSSAGAILAAGATLVIAGTAAYGYKTSFDHPEFKGTVIALDKCHGTAGRYLQAVAKQRQKRITVLAQDMGMTPWVAPDVRFVDVIGLTDHTVAHTLYAFRYTPYIRYLVWNLPGWKERIEEMEALLRTYLAKQKADFILVNISCEAGQTLAYRNALARLDTSFFQQSVEQNTFYYGYPGTPEFKNKYRLSQGFEFSAVHFLLLYERTEP